MMILALEFSSSQRSVAIARDGRVLAETCETGERATNAFGMIETVLAAGKIARAEVECLAIGLGPGSYTGIRVSLAIAQGWQLAADAKLLGIGSVDCLAAQAQVAKIFGRVNLVIDAQRGEFYLATKEISATSMEDIAPLQIVTAADVEARVNAGEILTGPDVTRRFTAGLNLFPSAAMLATLAARRCDFIAGEKLEPIYLRETTFVKAPPARTVANT